MTQWVDVLAEHMKNTGFVEGIGNVNPWTPELIGPNVYVAYCATAATLIPHHHGVDWGPDAQFPHKGIAYSPFIESWGKAHGLWAAGPDVDLLPGDIVTYDWGHDGVADHTETVVAVYADRTFDACGYNVGHPEGCHYPIRRDRKYLHGRLRMQGFFYDAVPPRPTTGGHVTAGYPFRATSAQFVDWVELDGFSWTMDSNGATFASPKTNAAGAGVPGVNGQPYFVGHTAAKLHVRNENGRYVSTVEDDEPDPNNPGHGYGYRPDLVGAPFFTH